ncbi:hypothetical protein HDV06_006806 [Boothiomyces sp. JEL0866]|nr:hypothetical protein HDV06_006806 [Boothiomyces sp. JEL0866]
MSKQEKPKRPINAFFRYKRAMRDYIKLNYKVNKNSDIAIISAKLWENEDPKVKTKYAKASEEEYTRYNATINMLELQGTAFDTNSPMFFNISEIDITNIAAENKMKTKSDIKPKRPINAFFRYKRDMRQVIAKKYNVQKNSQIASLCATMWENEDPAVKLYYAKETEREFSRYRSHLLEIEAVPKSIDLSGAQSFNIMDLTTGFTPGIEQCEPILNFISGQCLFKIKV